MEAGAMEPANDEDIFYFGNRFFFFSEKKRIWSLYLFIDEHVLVSLVSLGHILD